MEELIAIPVSEYERLKAAEKRLNELRQEQIDKANKRRAATESQHTEL